MAALAKTKNELNVRTQTINEDCISVYTCNLNKSFSFTAFDLAVLILSLLSIIIDMCTDLILVVQYSNQGLRVWALSTFVLIFLPSIIVQFFSLRWHIVDETADVLHWVLHFCMLGVVHRYILVIKSALSAYKSKNSSDLQKVLFDQNDLCMLHLFESFLESAPQLVLQIYVIIVSHEWRFWTGISATASLLSLAWALAAYTKAQRRARENKNSTTWLGLLFQGIWRTGMLTSRISTLVLGAYCFSNYFFLFIIFHWIGMTVWIISQKTDFCDTYWEEKIYNAVVGVIYCFCFFNLQEGQSRWRALVFYLIVIFQNLTCLTIYLMWYGERTPKLAVAGFISIIGGTIIGSTSMLFYYRFFHPSGPIKIFITQQTSQAVDFSPSFSSLTLRSLKRIRCGTLNENTTKSSEKTNSKQVLSRSSLSDSVVVCEENFVDDSDDDIKILQDWINGESENKSTITPRNESEETKSDVYKRRAVCSSVDLVKLLESKVESENGSLKLEGTEEASSEILSAHDYENLCAVNIAREIWGMRSWRGYSDIETRLHDDSVVHDRRLDTLTSTTSSDRSANTPQKENEKTRQEDYMDAIAEDLAQCDSEESSDYILGHYSIESLPVTYSLGALDPIFEESEESTTISSECNDLKEKNNSFSTLVAIIDEIRRNTPIQNRYSPCDNIYGFSDLDNFKSKSRNWKKVTFASELETFPKVNFVSTEGGTIKLAQSEQKHECIDEETIKDNTLCHAQKKESTASLKRNLITESKEINEIKISNKENIPTVANKINLWNKILSTEKEKIIQKNKKFLLTKKGNVLEKKSLFLSELPNFFTVQRKKES